MDMRKRMLLVVLLWIIVAGVVLALYHWREASPVKAFLDWALNMWPILLVLFMAAVAASAWVIRHDFGTGNKKNTQMLRHIPEIIFKMHKRLTFLVEHMTPLTETDIETFGEDYLELLELDESRYPELKQITPMSNIKTKREVIGAVFDRWLSTFIKMEDAEIKSLFIRIGGLMNVKGIGISQARDTDGQYTRLKGRLSKVQPEILPELNTAVDNYLQFSFGWLSLSRLISSITYGEITTALPPKYSAEMGIRKERMDSQMNELLDEVKGIIQRQTHEIVNSPSASHKVDA